MLKRMTRSASLTTEPGLNTPASMSSFSRWYAMSVRRPRWGGGCGRTGGKLGYSDIVCLFCILTYTGDSPMHGHMQAKDMQVRYGKNLLTHEPCIRFAQVCVLGTQRRPVQ